MSLPVFKVDPENPEKKIIDRATSIIKQGGIVVFPAKHLYGIAADALNKRAVKKVFDLKHRPENNPLLVLINKKNNLINLVDSVPRNAKVLIEKFWPGNITLVFEANNDLPMILTAKTGKIGVRIPWHPVTKSLVNHLGGPITGTSANISGMPGCSCINDLAQEIIQCADMVMDAGRLRQGRASTVVDVTVDPIKIIRRGELPDNKIFTAINFTAIKRIEQFY